MENNEQVSEEIMKNKEQVYDEQISPLMQQIIEICEGSKIAMVANFSIPTDEEPELGCLTFLNNEDSNDPFGLQHKRAVGILRGEAVDRPVIVTTDADGKKSLTAFI